MANYRDSDDSGEYQTKHNKKGFVTVLGMALIFAVGFMAYASNA